MDKTIKHIGVKGFDGVVLTVDLKKLSKASKNRSYPNLTNCCHKVVKQKKFCSECGAEVEGDCSHKLFKLGKEEHAIPAANLVQIKKALDSDDISIREYRDLTEVDPLYFTDVVFALKQKPKQRKEYVEFLELLKLTGKCAVGMMNYNSRPYPIMLYAHKGTILCRCLHFYEELGEVPVTDIVPINEQKVALQAQVMCKLNDFGEFDLGNYVNTREEAEQEIIMKVIEGQEIPEAEAPTALSTASDDEEMKKLQELLATTE